jgi:hypothetical protein
MNCLPDVTWGCHGGHYEDGCFLDCSALMMEAVQTFETLLNSYQSTRRYNTVDSHLHCLPDTLHSSDSGEKREVQWGSSPAVYRHQETCDAANSEILDIFTKFCISMKLVRIIKMWDLTFSWRWGRRCSEFRRSVHLSKMQMFRKDIQTPSSGLRTSLETVSFP